jgi:arginase
MISLIGAPSSAGAYAPGQERAPEEIRRAGLVPALQGHGIRVEDRGDVPGIRWRPDPMNPRAMNADAVATVAMAVANAVELALCGDTAVLVVGGDCTVELGTVAGCARHRGRTGLIYVDLDVDLNTPESTKDGALDWMGVAHMLGIEGTLDTLVTLGPRTPLLTSEDILLFAYRNVTAFEQGIIERRQIRGIHADEVARDPETAAGEAVKWARKYERMLVHFDVDVIDFESLPLAENTRRKIGLPFPTVMRALRGLLSAPNWRGLTVTEVNPDHGAADGSTMKTFAGELAASFAKGR